MATTSRKYATIKHPTIEALVNGRYRYKEKKQAIARFKTIAEYFVLSKEQPQSTKDFPVTVFWIKGFAVDEAETKAGYVGHFARMEIKTLESGLFTLVAHKVERPLASHPQKARPTSKHPNWGHPVMRAVKRGKPYATIEAAQAELDLLHLEFPEVSIPGPGKLYIIIYEKREGIKQPTHKIAVEITVRPEGGFILTARDNEKKQTPVLHASVDETTAQPAASGYFASTEALRKATRRKTVTRHTLAAEQDEAASFAAVEKERKKRKKKKAPPRVTATPPAPDAAEEAAAQARFRAAEEEREKRRRRRTTLFDATLKSKRDKPV